ncbi:MAG: ice-binding family protein [Candidatus Paceibacterota bacterium]
MKKLKNNLIAVAVAVAFVAGFANPVVVSAASTPTLGTASTFGIVSDTWTNSLNAGLETAINGNVCYTTPPDTAPISINGITVTPLSQAVVPCINGAAQSTALANLNSQACTSLGANVVLSGTYTPGCYSSSGTMDIALSTTVTLDGPGTYIFRSGGALTTGANSKVVLINGASASDVFWTPTGLASIGANSATSPTPTFVGNIIADTLGSTGVTLGHFAHLLGRVLAFGHTVTTDSNTITVPTTLRVIKTVINTSGGTAVSSDFTIHVKSAGVDVSGSPQLGAVTPGTAYSLSAGTYVVSENVNPSYTAIFSGDCNSSGSVTLALGDSKTCTITNTDTPPPPTPSSTGGSTFSPLPLINITKIPSPVALPLGAGVVNYTYTATNIGPVAMSNVWVKDNKCSQVNFVSGDTNNNSWLDLSEAWIYRCTKTVSQTETNTATARGFYNGWDTYDTANATVVVGSAVTPPLIHLVKKPSVSVLPIGGGAVTYAYTVTNPGTAPLSNVSITDDKCTGLPGRVTGHPGDINSNNLLESNETWSFTCQTNITQTTTNIGTAVGYANGLTAVDFSSATVVVPEVLGATVGFPNAGFPPERGNTLWFVATLIGVIALVSTTLKVVLKKRTV